MDKEYLDFMQANTEYAKALCENMRLKNQETRLRLRKARRREAKKILEQKKALEQKGSKKSFDDLELWLAGIALICFIFLAVMAIGSSCNS